MASEARVLPTSKTAAAAFDYEEWARNLPEQFGNVNNKNLKAAAKKDGYTIFMLFQII